MIVIKQKPVKDVYSTVKPVVVKHQDYAKMVMETENPIVLSFTNKAIENVKSKLISKGFNKEKVNKTCYTFDSYFCEWNGTTEETNIKSLENKTIFIEEFSMVPNKWITNIYKTFTMFKNIIYVRRSKPM